MIYFLRNRGMHINSKSHQAQATTFPLNRAHPDHSFPNNCPLRKLGLLLFPIKYHNSLLHPQLPPHRPPPHQQTLYPLSPAFSTASSPLPTTSAHETPDFSASVTDSCAPSSSTRRKAKAHALPVYSWLGMHSYRVAKIAVGSQHARC